MKSTLFSYTIPHMMAGLSALLVLPALLTNLGMLAFIDDEAIRALVTLEMMLSGNYITPTLQGEFYYNKPPLYNWMLIPLYSLFSKPEEWMSRFYTVLALLLFCFSIFRAFRPQYGARIAMLTALAFLTTGRVLFWESFLGLIDMWFSLTMFGMFMVVYRGYARRAPLFLFACAYALAAAGFLFKGLPAIVFLGGTLLAGGLFFKQWRQWFSWQHIVGAGIFVSVVGGYYALYSQIHPLEELWFRLVDESAKRTPVQKSFTETIFHLVSFPFEVVYHFLPWTLFAGVFAVRSVRQALFQNKLTGFLLLTLGLNSIPYWLSPEVYPRYLLMLLPLLLGPSLFGARLLEKKYPASWRMLMNFFLGVMILLVPASVLPMVWDRLAEIPFRFVKSLFLLVGMTGLVGVAFRARRYVIWALIPFLLLVRLGFDWFVIPDRVAHDLGHLSRQASIRIGELTRGEKLYIYNESAHGVLNDFHLTAERGEIVRIEHSEHPDPTAWYLIDPHFARQVSHFTRDSMPLRHDTMLIRLVRLK